MTIYCLPSRSEEGNYLYDRMESKYATCTIKNMEIRLKLNVASYPDSVGHPNSNYMPL